MSLLVSFIQNNLPILNGFQDDMNFRVALQYEFSNLNLDEFLANLKDDSDLMDLHISAYDENILDVHELMEDSEAREAAVEKATELEEELTMLQEKFDTKDAEAISQQVTRPLTFHFSEFIVYLNIGQLGCL